MARSGRAGALVGWPAWTASVDLLRAGRASGNRGRVAVRTWHDAAMTCGPAASSAAVVRAESARRGLFTSAVSAALAPDLAPIRMSCLPPVPSTGMMPAPYWVWLVERILIVSARGSARLYPKSIFNSLPGPRRPCGLGRLVGAALSIQYVKCGHDGRGRHVVMTCLGALADYRLCINGAGGGHGQVIQYVKY